VLKVDSEPRRVSRAPYNLQLLLQPGFHFPTAPEDNLREVRLQAVRLQKKTSDERIVFDVGSGRSGRSVHDLINEALNEMNLPRENTYLTQATLQALFETGRKRPKSVRFTITQPAGCTLRDSDEELILR